MAVKIGALFSCLAASFSSPSHTRRSFQLSLTQRWYDSQHDSQQLRYAKVESSKFVHGMPKSRWKFLKRTNNLFAILEDQSQFTEVNSVASEQESHHSTEEDFFPASNTYVHFERSAGKPGLISFYDRPYKEGDGPPISIPQSMQKNFLWLIGPAVLVASFIFPSLYLRRVLATVFEDSLLTDFLILFFTEALFYCGVAVFLLLIDLVTRPTNPDSIASNYSTLVPQLGQRISSVAALVLSLIIPMVTMGLVWPWTGPAASATLAPYLVGIVVQFAFEQYARHKKSRSWPAIPIIFQVYRLHQLNRAAQLVTALSFTIKGAEMTAHNLAINNSLGTLLNVLQCLGVICIWSLSSFLMRFIPSTAMSVQ